MNSELTENRISSRVKPYEILIFTTGLFSLVYVHVVGQLYVSEILLFLLAPVLWARRGRVLLRRMESRTIMALGVLWLLGQAITDLIRETPLVDLARGWVSIAVFLMAFSSLYLLVGNNTRRIKMFAWGFAFSGLLSAFLQPSPFFDAEPWKFGFGQPVVLIAFLLVIGMSKGQLNRMRWGTLLPLALGVLSFYLRARALAGALILSGAVVWLRSSRFSGRLLARVRMHNILGAALVIMGIAFGLLYGYSYTVQQGLFGERAKEKFQMQYSGNALGVLLGGRAEVLASAPAIFDSPIIGHGSWAKGREYRLHLFQLAELGYQRDPADLNELVFASNLIPTYSHFTQAWVWAGFLGAVFWAWLLLFLRETFFRANELPNELYPLVIFRCIRGVWNILFSPFGGNMRLVPFDLSQSFLSDV